ncbi:MAG: hypothetical protein WB989_07570, partial [Mycobacterium sp.]
MSARAASGHSTNRGLCAASSLSWYWQSYETRRLVERPGVPETRRMNSISSGTVLITGPTGGLGKSAALAMA